tara:strand:- start:951 stop:1271 length:321 start_codon:yes stop_codon:yes gene_type:complete
MSLQLGSEIYYFRPTVGSPFIYCAVDFYVPRPWIHLAIRFGSQLCYSGYLYAYELYKEITTEVGLLIVRVLLQVGLPCLRYFFVIKPWPCLKAPRSSLNSPTKQVN